jgi:hypothetical protein
MEKYNRLSIISKEPSIKEKWGTRVIVKCICECGNIKNFRLGDLKSGKTKSCGCLHKENIIKHDDGTKGNKHYYLYQTWYGMMKRCYNINSSSYRLYGFRGIKVFTEFHNYLNFKKWILNNLGERPENYSLDRINCDGNYEPNNIRWADKLTQTKNRRPFKATNKYTKL